MKPFYRLIMRAEDCVGVVAGANGEATIVIEISGGTAAVNRMLDKIPGEAETAEEWVEDLFELLPMTYKLGTYEDFEGDVSSLTSEDVADALAEANISSAGRSSKLVTTRVSATATILSDATGGGSILIGDDDEDEAAALAVPIPAPVEDPVAEAEEAQEDPEAEPDAEMESEPEPEPAPVAPPVVIVETAAERDVLSVADDGAGLQRNWFLLLEDWQGFAAVFAGDRDSYAVLSRAATEDMSRQIAQAVPSEAANLEHWVTSLIRKLPAGVWLRAFSNVRSLSAEELNTPEEMLRAVVDFYGTPSPARQAEFYGTGAVDGSLEIDPKADAFQTAVVDGVKSKDEPEEAPGS